MECKDIREKLSAYVEGVVSSEEQAAIEIHLKSCPRCSEALSDLSKTIEHLKTLEEVTPPAWLTQNIMTKVRAEAEPGKGVFQRLFYPLHIKLPVGAIATIAIALTTIYIFRTIQPEIKLDRAPTEEIAPQVSERQERAPLTTPALGKGGFEKRDAAPSKPAERRGPSKETEFMRDRLETAPEAPEPMKHAPPRAQEPEKKEEAKTPVPEKRPEQLPAPGAIAKDEALQESRATAPEAKLSYMEKKKEEMLTLSVLVKDPEAAVKEIEKTLKELDGKTVHTESLEERRTITGEINAAKLKELIGKLRFVGQVKEKDIDVETMKGELGVRIEIVKNPRSD